MRLVDPNPWRTELREAWAALDRERLKALAAELREQTLTAESFDLLARCLYELGEREESIAIYRRASLLYPEDYRINHNLASQLDPHDPALHEETERLLAEAYANHPERTGKRETRHLKRERQRWFRARLNARKKKEERIAELSRRMEKRSRIV